MAHSKAILTLVIVRLLVEPQNFRNFSTSVSMSSWSNSLIGFPTRRSARFRQSA
jgi:hypothetical protein